MTMLNAEQATKVLKSKGYDDAYIANYLRNSGQIQKDQHNMANRAPRYNSTAVAPNIATLTGPEPAAVAPTPAAPTPTPAPTTPTTPTETPHQKALRLAREKGTSEYSRLYGNTALAEGDPYDIDVEFNRLLEEALGKVPAADNDVSNYVNYGDIFSQAQNTRTGAERNKLTQAYNAATPTGWQNQFFADTADDRILQQILGGQAQNVTTDLDRQLGRGQISQAAYDYAKGQLGYDPTKPGQYSGLSSSAYSTLQGLGGGVLSGYREGLGDIADEFNKSITGYTLGQNIDPTSLGTNLTNQANTYKTGLEGDITKALGNTKLFDPKLLVSTASGVAGPSNQPLYGSTPQGTGQVLEDDRRTIGTSGTF